MIHQRARTLPRALRWASAINAMMPPSPLLSARMMNTTYLSDTTMTSDQNISDNTPSTLFELGGMPCSPNVVCTA